jgi:DNA invertase Pin-like site-specific DNA recombinase
MRYGYGRVSTKDQDAGLQEDAVRAYGIDEFYRDVISGTTTSRPQLDGLLEILMPGDVLVIWKLDRLGRSLSHLALLSDELRSRGVRLVSLTEGMDTETSTGRLLFGIMASMAQFERDLIVERTKAGLEHARAQGRVGGRKRRVNRVKVLAMINQGVDKQEVAQRNGTTIRTVDRILKELVRE